MYLRLADTNGRGSLTYLVPFYIYIYIFEIAKLSLYVLDNIHLCINVDICIQGSSVRCS